MNQHYVPQWYLKRWTVDGSDDVCVFDPRGALRILPVGRAGASEDWYTTLLPDGSRDDAVELKLLQTVDDGGATTTRALLAHGKLGPRQLEKFCRFLGWFVVRGPQLNLRATRAATQLDAARARGDLGEESSLLGSTALTRDGRRLPLPDGPFRFSHDDSLEMLRRNRVPQGIAEMFRRRADWFHVRRLDEPLLETCDAPVIYEDEFAESAELALTTILPLSPDSALVIGAQSEPTPEVLRLEEREFARRVNALVMAAMIDQRYCKPALVG